MRKQIKIGSIALAIYSLVACGSNKKDAGTPVVSPVPATPISQTNLPLPFQGQQLCLNKNLPGTYYYQFRDGIAGCSTGRQTFATLQEKCNALMDDVRNNNCARQFRVNEYNLECACNNNQVVAQTQTVATVASVNAQYKNVTCSIVGMDSSGKFLSSFSNRDNVRMLTWNSRKKDHYSLPFGLTNKFGKARLDLTPADKNQEARAKITLQQDDESKIITAEAGIDQTLRLAYDDQENQTSVILECTVDGASQAQRNLSKVVCVNNLQHGRNNETAVKPIDWDTKVRRDVEVELGVKSIESFVAQLLPPIGQTPAAVELQGQGIDFSKQIRVRGSLSSSVIMTYQDKNLDYQLNMNCSAQ